ncbi:MAG TPA: shikimate dehydrogenase [Candidatus Binataceae bacterium]
MSAASQIRAIAATTQLSAVFGDPVEHSLSPAMHNAAYAALNIDRAYLAFHVRAEELATALRAIPALNILGVNLTVPHKERAAALIKDLNAEARLLAAVNCVVNRRGRLLGDNSDARGLEADLREHGVDLRGKQALVIGAGGGAAAAVLACLRRGARQIVIANRTTARAMLLARRFARLKIGRSQIVARGLDALTDRELLGECELVINATPMGLTTARFAPLNYPATATGCTFYDMVYAREPTAFIKPAIALRRRAADGAGMLVAQGELAFKLFNGVSAPAGVMRAALWERLGRAPVVS